MKKTLKQLQSKLYHPSPKLFLAISFAISVLYSSLALHEAFSHEYVIQDDARQHIFWMQRFLDSELFSNDLIANYFQSVAPLGYKTLYQIFAFFQLNPIFISKILPTFLGLITTYYCFQVCLMIIPLPIAGLISSVLLNQQLWLNDGLVSATPRAFIYPLFLIFLYYLLRKSILSSGIAICLIGLFYPQYILIVFAILFLRLFRIESNNLHLNVNQNDCFVSLVGLAISFIVILFYAIQSNNYGPVITVEEAKIWSEFGGAGNSAFFDENLWQYFIFGQRSGFIARHLFRPPLLFIGLLLPILTIKFNTFENLNRIKILYQIILSSFGCFICSHLFLFKLHLPSRYTRYSFQICLALAAGISICIIIDILFRWSLNKPHIKRWQQVTTLGLILIIGLNLALGSVFWGKFPKTSYIIGEVPRLYEFFKQQPKDILIASITKEVDNIPTFSQRSIWFGWEYAVPYHLGYYNQIKQRATDFITAQYEPDLNAIKTLIQLYEINFIMVDKSAFESQYILKNKWLTQWYYSLGQEIEQSLQKGEVPALVQTLNQCSDLDTSKLYVLNADCILDYSPEVTQ
ncbi:MAG: hypothetical protein WBA13_05425 [Microcoleaceae cyanobacterium]